MRDLIIMRGCPGSGKSSAIKAAGLEAYTLSPDSIRLMLRAPELSIDNRVGVSQKDNALVFELMDRILVNRMKTGSPTIIDATHCSSQKWHSRQINRYKELAKRYKYRLFYWEPERQDLEVYLQKNETRPSLDYVPEHIIRTMYNNWVNAKMPFGITKLNTLEFRSDFEGLNKDLSKVYDKVICVGDIHGCNTVLEKLIYDEKYSIDNDKNLYIFVGDYFDRGIENLEVLNTLFKIQDKKNVILLEGNHEAHWADWAFGEADQRTDNGMTRFKLTTLKEWQKEYTSDKELSKKLRILYRNMIPAFYFKFGDKKYCVNHAGLMTQPVDFMAAEQYINGHGAYESDVASFYEICYERSDTKINQIFGHRGAKRTEHNIPLEGQVEFGGYLKYFVLSKDGEEYNGIRNKVYDKNYIETNQRLLEDFKGEYYSTDDFEVNAIANSRHVRVKKLPNNILSLNFSEEVFHHSIWNDITIKARGLFVDAITSEVLARSYDKFFNIGERNNKEDEIKELQYPVRLAMKENGFLGIISWDHRRDELIIASKSTTEKDHARYIKDVWNLISEEVKEQIIRILKKSNCSAVFEVIHPDDPHIVNYHGQKRMYLLDFVPNVLHLANGRNIDRDLSEALKGELSKNINLAYETTFSFVKQEIVYAPYQFELGVEKLVGGMQDIEGYVITDNASKMYKVKCDHYNTWKRRRKTFQSFKEILFDESMPEDIKLSKLDHINKRIGEKTPELFNKIKEQDSLFIQFLKEMNYDPNCNIIQLRELYNDYVDKRH